MPICFICGGNQTDYIEGTDVYLNTTNKIYRLVKCDKCGLEQINPMPNIDDILGFYKSDYYSYNKSTKNNLYIAIDNVLKLIYTLTGVSHRKLDINNYKKGDGLNFLEIGCGYGAIVENMQKNGYNSEGFELGGKTEFKNNIHYGQSIVDYNFNKTYDLIYVSHVFEHIRNPTEFLNKIHNLLNDNGECIILLPSVDSIASTFFKNFSIERDIPRHLFNYSFQNIQNLFISQGFKITYKGKMRQYGIFNSLCFKLKNQYNINFENKILGKIINLFILIIIENILNLFKNTNQMGFIIKKDN